jgi:hypothetical protein
MEWNSNHFPASSDRKIDSKDTSPKSEMSGSKDGLFEDDFSKIFKNINQPRSDVFSEYYKATIL